MFLRNESRLSEAFFYSKCSMRYDARTNAYGKKLIAPPTIVGAIAATLFDGESIENRSHAQRDENNEPHAADRARTVFSAAHSNFLRASRLLCTRHYSNK